MTDHFTEVSNKQREENTSVILNETSSSEGCQLTGTLLLDWLDGEKVREIKSPVMSWRSSRNRTCNVNQAQ